MVRHFFFCVLLALLAVGCDRQKGPSLRKVEKEADRAIRKLGEPNRRDPLLRVGDLIQSETNRAVRAACYRFLQDKLCGIKLRGDDYERQCRVFLTVWSWLLPYRWSETGRWTIEDECNAKIRQFGWMSRELDRWKTMVTNGEASQLKKENPVKFESWRRAYRYCLGRYESLVFSFEKQFDGFCKSYHASDEERSKAKALVATFLGRSMRTREEMRRDWQERKVSDEMRAIQRMEWQGHANPSNI